MKMLTFFFVCTVLSGCASGPSLPEQELVLEKQLYQMHRSETIDAIKECETSGTRAVPIWGRRKVNGHVSAVIIEITCAPSWK